MEAITGVFLNAVEALRQFGVRDIIDIAIVTIVIYKLLMATRQTRAIQVFKGVGFVLIAATLADFFNLASVGWLLSTILQSGVVFAIVLFQPELRKALEGIGRGGIFAKGNEFNSENDIIVEQITNSLLQMSTKRIGALIVLQKNSNLTDIINTGTKVNATISSALLQNIFEPNTPLHDGAVIINNSSIVAAGCVLPLSDNYNISKDLGTRHRAGLGVSEISDSITFIVSEETGVISYTNKGKIIRYLDRKTIQDILSSIFIKNQAEEKKFASLIRRLKNEN